MKRIATVGAIITAFAVAPSIAVGAQQAGDTPSRS